REAAQWAHRHREAVLQEGIHAVRQLLVARGAARGEPWLGRTRCSAVPTAGPSSRSGPAAATPAGRGTPSWKKRSGGRADGRTESTPFRPAVRRSACPPSEQGRESRGGGPGSRRSITCSAAASCPDRGLLSGVGPASGSRLSYW